MIPSKIFECMGMGIPILHGVEGESAGIVAKEGVGIAFEPENAQALADALQVMAGDIELRSRLSLAGPPAAARYSRRALALEMLALLARLARKR